MIYNGMEFPVSPKRDGYPCAAIYEYSGIWYLVLFSEPNKVNTDKLCFWGVGIGWVQFELVDDEWVERNTGFDNYTVLIDRILWANYDVLDLNGNVYLAASEPLTLFVVTHTIHADLLERGVRPRIDVVQGDSLTRRVEFILTAGGVPWNPPDDTAAALSYVRPDGAGKVYDKLPDGLTAYTVSGNRVRMMLLPELMEVAGDVMAALRIVRESDGRLLSSFPIDVVVEPEPSYLVRPVSNDTPTEPDSPVVASLYIYGTPSTSGNIGLRSGDSVTYYDGLVKSKLPDIPEGHPWVCMMQPFGPTTLDMWPSEPVVHIKDSGINGYLPKEGTVTLLYSEYRSDSNEWGEFKENTYSSTQTALSRVEPFWTNKDLYTTDGTLYLAGTDPIPVGEIVDTINDIPIYEDLR